MVSQRIGVVSALAFALVAWVPSAEAERRKNSIKPERGAAPCVRVVAKLESVRNLAVVGVVQQGRSRVVLMMDTAKRGHLVRAGECVGRERVPFEQLLPKPVPQPQPTTVFET